MIPWSAITTVATEIYNQAEKARINKKQTKRLVERIRLLIDSVLRMQTIADNEAYKSQHQALKKTLDETLTLTMEFQSEHWFSRFGKAGGWKEKIDDLNQQLTDRAEAFGIGMQVQGFINREADQTALAEDMTNLQELVVEALKATNHTQDDLEAIAAILKEIKNYSVQFSQDHQIILTKLDALVSGLESTAKTTETEIVVVDDGATVGKLVNQYIDKKFSYKAPSDISDATLERLKKFSSDLDASIPKRKINITVVKKGGHVDDLLQETINFLLHFELTDPSKEEQKNSSSDQVHSSSVAVQPALQLKEEVIQRSQPSFWGSNRNTLFVAAAAVTAVAAAAWGLTNKG